MTEVVEAKRLRRWWTIGGALVGAAILIWILSRLDYERLRITLAEAEIGFLLLVPLAIAVEQLVRAWKWCDDYPITDTWIMSQGVV